MLLKLLIRAKPFVIIGLSFLFLFLFGRPAFQTYNNYDVFFKEYNLKPQALTSPAITICLEPVSCSIYVKKNWILDHSLKLLQSYLLIKWNNIYSFPGRCNQGSTWICSQVYWLLQGRLEQLVLVGLQQLDNNNCRGVPGLHWIIFLHWRWTGVWLHDIWLSQHHVHQPHHWLETPGLILHD